MLLVEAQAARLRRLGVGLNFCENVLLKYPLIQINVQSYFQNFKREEVLLSLHAHAEDKQFTNSIRCCIQSMRLRLKTLFV